MDPGVPRLPVATLDAILTAACNLSCAYCYQDAKSNRRMDWATLRRCVDLLLASDREEVRLTFYGGEPLLQFPMIRRAVAYAGAEKSRRKRLHFGIVTNGTLLSAKVAAFLARHRFETRLSFDGIAPAQDLRAKGTFEALDRLLDHLQARHPRFFREDLGINITLHSGNLRCLADSIDYFLEKGVHSIAVGPLVTHDGGWRRDSIQILDRQSARVFRSCVRHYRRTGTVPLALFRKNEAGTVHDPTGLSLCGVGGGETLSVDPDGRVHGCVMFVEAYQTLPSTPLSVRLRRTGMGPLRDPGFAARYARFPAGVRRARIFDDRHLKHSSYRRCGRCRYAGDCSICPVSILHEPGNADPHRVPDAACAFNLVTLKYRQRFPSPPGPYDFLLGRQALPVKMLELRAFARTISARTPGRLS